jgi:tRNA pseudouridine13 synthase
MKKAYAYRHDPITFDFTQSVERFFVEEIPYSFSNRGAHLILKIKKQNMSTFKLLSVLSKALHVNDKEIGYAGLKDKDATTIQYLSLPKQTQHHLNNITTERIEVLEQCFNDTPLKIGALQANRFEIVLEQLKRHEFERFKQQAEVIERLGFPNYFGYQRFGTDQKSYEQGKTIAHSGKKLRGAKERLLVAAYQSYLFNNWLSYRIETSHVIVNSDIHTAAKKLAYPLKLVEVLKAQPHFFKLFLGDLIHPYPYGRFHYIQDLKHEAQAFHQAQITPTGPLFGSHYQRSHSDAAYIEQQFEDDNIANHKGDRRAAWVWPKHLKLDYNPDLKSLHISFELPKGAYATTFLEAIACRALSPKNTEFS